MGRVQLTTFDNPYNPFEDYVKWHMHDCLTLGYNSSEYLSRIAHTSDQLTDYENEQEIERAIDEIIDLDPFNIYRKISEDEKPEETKRIAEEFLTKQKRA